VKLWDGSKTKREKLPGYRQSNVSVQEVLRLLNEDNSAEGPLPEVEEGLHLHQEDVVEAAADLPELCIQLPTKTSMFTY
jgi:hypothetical protein